MATLQEAQQNLIDLLAAHDGIGRFEEGDDSASFESTKNAASALASVAALSAVIVTADNNNGVEVMF